MKIGVYFPGFSPESGGGHTFEHEILLSLCELAQQCRHELMLFFENALGDEISAILAKKGLKFILLEPPPRVPIIQRVASKILRELNLPMPPEAPRRLREAVEREKVELVWFPVDVTKQVDVGAPYIATVFDIQHCIKPWFPEVSQSGEWESREKNYFEYIRRAAYILTPNLVGQKEISLFYGVPSERFRLLPYPSPSIYHVPSVEQVQNVLAKYHLAEGYLFYPAQFWPHKNHANLLMAFQALRDKFAVNKYLVLVGSDKGNLEYIRSLASALGIDEQVQFLDFVAPEDLIALYHAAFALTYLSLSGPSNLPPMEAFMCGCPVIVSDYDGAREQLGDAALFVNGLDPEAIAKTINDLESQPELRLALIERGRTRAASYSWESYIRDVNKIFDEFEAVRRTWGSTFYSI